MSIDIKKRRAELNLTLEEIGNYVGVSKSTVKKWENGYIKNMRRDKILLLSKILKVSPLDFLNISKYKEKTATGSKLLSEEFIKKIESDLGTSLPPDSVIYFYEDNYRIITLSEEQRNAFLQLIQE